MAKARRSGGGFGRVLLGFVLGVVAVGVVGFVYFKWRRPLISSPVKPFFTGKAVARPADVPHSERELKRPPFGVSEDVYEAGAHVYSGHCAGCHGTPGRDSALARTLRPSPSQFWSKHGKGAGKPASAIYAKVADGISGSGMPAYEHVLPETAMWQVSLLLANAGKPLPEPVTRILTAP